MDLNSAGAEVKVLERYISVWAMLFNFHRDMMSSVKTVSLKLIRQAIITARVTLLLPAVFILLCFNGTSICSAELIDKVIAYVDDRAITYSEYMERYEIIRQSVPGITKEETLNSMINALLLLQRAKKMRLEAPTEDDLIKEYLDIIIKSRIVINEVKILEYYNKNRLEFGEKEFAAVRPSIEKYLLELETNIQLKEHLKELRTQANIVILPKDR
jgi:hypothetical protein